VPILLIANKCDDKTHRKVKTKDGENFARENGLVYLETSAQDNTNVKEAFDQIACLILSSNKDS
jgi:Ras-related protein Rab-2A